MYTNLSSIFSFFKELRSSPVFVSNTGICRLLLGMNIWLRRLLRIGIAGSRYLLWKGTLIGRKWFVRVDLRSFDGIRVWSTSGDTLNRLNRVLSPHKDVAGPATT